MLLSTVTLAIEVEAICEKLAFNFHTRKADSVRRFYCMENTSFNRVLGGF
jgi:hypothetical protein